MAAEAVGVVAVAFAFAEAWLGAAEPLYSEVECWHSAEDATVPRAAHEQEGITQEAEAAVAAIAPASEQLWQTELAKSREAAEESLLEEVGEHATVAEKAVISPEPASAKTRMVASALKPGAAADSDFVVEPQLHPDSASS